MTNISYMLALTGFLLIFTFMCLILSKRMSGFAALIIVPICFAIFSGYGLELGDMMLHGLKMISPTAVMMLFAVIYFGIMVDVGLFDALIVKILKTVNGDPLKIVLGTALLAMLASLEGEGAVVFLIVCSAMLPLYRKLGINPVILAVICVMDAAVKNLFPWSAPSARVISVLGVGPDPIFQPLIPVIIAGYCWLLFAAYMLGKRERARIGIVTLDTDTVTRIANEVTARHAKYKRPKLFFINLALTLALMTALLINALPVVVTFIIGTALALVINYHSIDEQQAHLNTHAGEALTVAGVVFAAGIFLGILSETNMMDAMANALVSAIPDYLGAHLSIVTALLSAPLSFLLSNNAFYFGVLPVLNQAAGNYGISAAEIGRASLLGTPMHVLSPLVAAIWLLVGMCKITLADLQRGGIWWCFGLMAVNIAVALLVGAITF